MFLGPLEVGFGSKPATPKTSLGVLFLAARFVDQLWAFWVDRQPIYRDQAPE